MYPHNVLESLVVALSEGAYLKGRDLCEGLLAFGSTGSGKTTALLRTLVLGLLALGSAAGMATGFLVLCPKSSDIDDWLGYARQAGREHDVVILKPGGQHTFDPLAYLWSLAKDLEAIIDFIDLLLCIGRNAVESSADRFWELSVAQWVRAAVRLLSLADHAISIATISRLIDSLPNRPGEFGTEAWQRESYCATVLAAIQDRREMLTESEWAELDVALGLTCVTIPAMDERTRSNIKATFSGMADKFLYEPFCSLFASGRCSVTPADVTERGRIILIDVPYTTYGIETARLIGCGVKAAFQRGFLARTIAADSRLVCFVADEAHLFVLPKSRDVQYQSVCRASRAVTLAFVQSINAIAEAHGEHMPGARTRAWCANLATKVALRSTCTTTNEFLADLIGKDWSTVRNMGVGGTSSNFSEQEQLRHYVDPVAFADLATPNGTSPIAEAIVFQNGKRFSATKSPQHPQGLPYLRVAFTRE